MNIKQDTLVKLDELGYSVWAYNSNVSLVDNDDKDYKSATHIMLGIIKDDCVITKSIKTPKTKEVTLEWVLEKFSVNYCYYKSLRKYLVKLFDNRSSIYAASYGLGIDNTFGNYKQVASEVENKLRELGIKYRTEFSNAAWVFRFIVSKDRENMNILKQLE